MKHLVIKLTLYLFATASIISSCKKESTSDNTPTGTGSFSVNGKSYNTPYGFIDKSNGFFDLQFTDVANISPNYKSLAGFQILSSDESLVSKTYPFVFYPNTGLVEGYFDINGIGGIRFGNPNSGSMTISKDGNTYNITYTITVRDSSETTIADKVITGSYKGSLTTLIRE